MEPVVRLIGQVKCRAARSGESASLTENRGPSGIQMVERVPCPDDLQVTIHDDDHVAKHIDGARPLDAGEKLLDRREHEYLAVRERPGLMMEGANLRPGRSRTARYSCSRRSSSFSPASK